MSSIKSYHHASFVIAWHVMVFKAYHQTQTDVFAVMFTIIKATFHKISQCSGDTSHKKLTPKIKHVSLVSCHSPKEFLDMGKAEDHLNSECLHQKRNTRSPIQPNSLLFL